jgi:hypothetical protein
MKSSRRDPKNSSAKKRDDHHLDRAPKKPRATTVTKQNTSPLRHKLASNALIEIASKDRPKLADKRDRHSTDKRDSGDDRRDKNPPKDSSGGKRRDGLTDKSWSSRRSIASLPKEMAVRFLDDEPSYDELDEQRTDLDIWTAEALTEYINDYYTFRKIFVDVGGYIIPEEQDCDFQFIRAVIAGRKSVLPPGTEITTGPPKSKSINVKKLFRELSVMTPFHQFMRIYPENTFPQKWWFWTVLKYTKRE